jgi:hypothetical protein
MLALFLIVFIIFIISIVWLWYMGALNQVEMKSKTMDRKLFLYREYVGQYKNIGSVYENMGKNLMHLFSPSKEAAGIYYDNPKVVQDPNSCRAVCGLLLQEEDRQKAESFAAANPVYKFRELPEAECIYTRYPYKSKMSFIFLVARVYPEIKAYVLKNIVKDPSEIKGIMEIYHMDIPNPCIEVAVPFGQGTEGYLLSCQPEPQHRYVDDKKLN